MTAPDRRFVVALLAVAVLAAGAAAWYATRRTSPEAGLISGNGRIEATEIDVAARAGGRVLEILAAEGDFVKAGQVVARMQTEVLQAQRDEARAGHERALHAVDTARAQVAARESDVATAKAVVRQREAELEASRRQLARTEFLAREGARTPQELDDVVVRARSAEAALSAAQAQVAAARAAVSAAKAQLVGARSGVAAAAATVARIDAEIADCQLESPRDGRVQYRVAQPGEVVGAGGKVLNLIDLADVYMTFFLPEAAAGRVALGGEVRVVLDAAPDHPIPARVSFVASEAQFTPKMVETASERQKLMFRVKARVDPALLQRHITKVKTGLPGVAWLKLNAGTEWPAKLALRDGP